MKVCVIQPYYSMQFSDADKCFNEMIGLMDQCDFSLDLIVLPEYCDIPVKTPNEKEFKNCIEKYNKIIEAKCMELAKRCQATVFANFAYKTENGYRNTTHAIDKNGKTVGRYFKAHPAPSEYKTVADGGNEMDVSYVGEYKPYTVTIDGIKFGFMTSYDFYFYEDFLKLARENVDVVIGCSHQRTDTHDFLETVGKFLSYNTNSFLVRSAVSLGADSPVCGCSMVVNPKGETLLNMKNKVGLGIVDIDVKDKYYKPAGFLGAQKSHWEYVDEGRAYIEKRKTENRS